MEATARFFILGLIFIALTISMASSFKLQVLEKERNNLRQKCAALEETNRQYRNAFETAYKIEQMKGGNNLMLDMVKEGLEK
jgi:hypothetical protein